MKNPSAAVADMVGLDSDILVFEKDLVLFFFIVFT